MVLETALLAISEAFCSLLFLLRVRAVYSNCIRVTLVFGTLWILEAPINVLAVKFIAGRPWEGWRHYTHTNTLER